MSSATGFETAAFVRQYRPAPTDASTLPSFADAGTGGLLVQEFFESKAGYPLFEILNPPARAPESPFTKLMEDVRAGFGRTMSHLPEVFGVSRQTLYNWLDGETPKEQHHAKLRELASAARVFSEAGFKPTSAMLERTILSRKSLLQLIGAGANGKETAAKLIRIVQRDEEALRGVDEMLSSRKPSRPEVSDMGLPSFSEDDA